VGVTDGTMLGGTEGVAVRRLLGTGEGAEEDGIALGAELGVTLGVLEAV